MGGFLVSVTRRTVSPCRVPWKTAPGVGLGVVVSVTELEGVMVFYDTGCSLVCAVRVLAVCEDIVQICSVLVLGAGMFVKHCTLQIFTT